MKHESSEDSLSGIGIGGFVLMKIQPPIQLGQTILIIVDSAPDFFDALTAMTPRLPDITHRYFTLFCCCPTPYWEHGGADTPESQDDLKAAWDEEETELSRAERCAERAAAILREAGVPESHIRTIHTTADHPVGAAMEEIKRGGYSGVVVSQTQHDLVNRLLGRGLTDLFRHTPQVEVWVLEPAAERHPIA
ncbi:MAG: hypothetical protein JNL42_18335 [Anaerolineae bacterium]|nr:hypothetical protein [Anaerolineae bacterium]